MTKMDEIVTLVKSAEAKAKEEKCNKTIKTIFAILGVIVVIALVAYAVYKFITKCKEKTEDAYADCDYEDAFEDEESCIELEFVYPCDEEAVPVEAEEMETEDEE